MAVPQQINTKAIIFCLSVFFSFFFFLQKFMCSKVVVLFDHVPVSSASFCRARTTLHLLSQDLRSSSSSSDQWPCLLWKAWLCIRSASVDTHIVGACWHVTVQFEYGPERSAHHSNSKKKKTVFSPCKTSSMLQKGKYLV